MMRHDGKRLCDGAPLGQKRLSFSDTFSRFSVELCSAHQKGVDANTAGAIWTGNLTENAHFSVEPLFSFDDKHHLKVIGSYRLFRDQYMLDQRIQPI